MAVNSSERGRSSRRDPDVVAVRDNEQVLGFLLALHGLVHVVGFLLAWRLYAPADFSYDDVWPDAATLPGRAVGLVWLAVAVALLAVGGRMSNAREVRTSTLSVVLIASIAVCATAFPQAIPGAAISATVLASMAVLWIRRRAAGR